MDRRGEDDELLTLGRAQAEEIIEIDERRRPIAPRPSPATTPEAGYARGRDDPASLAGIWRALGELTSTR